MNRYGDKGQPCLIPLSSIIKFFGTPLIIIEKETVDMQFMISLIHLIEKPSFAIV